MRSLAFPGIAARLGGLVLGVGFPFAILAVVLLGGYLRLDGLGWDTPRDERIPFQMHPDERFISIVNAKIEWPSGAGEYFDTARSPLNPYNQPETPSFVYGTFPIFTVKAVASLARSDTWLIAGLADDGLCGGVVGGRDRGGGELSTYDTTVVCGRHVTALVDTLTIVLVLLLGSVLFGRAAGLLGGLFYALAVLPAQVAHFWTVDTWAVSFGVATLLLSALFVRNGRATPGRGALLSAGLLVTGMGVCAGLGLASKVTAWPIMLGPLSAVAVRVGMREFPRLGLRWQGEATRPGGHWTTDLSMLCVVGLVAIVSFRIAQPYAFAGPNFWDMGINNEWRADIAREADFQQGNVDFPPFVQFAGRSALLWPLENLVLWGLGPALGMAGFGAAAAAAVLLFRRRDTTALALLLTLIAVLAFQKSLFGAVPFPGTRLTAYMRYFLLAYPVLCLFAGWGISMVVAYARSARAPSVALAGRMAAFERLRPGTPAFRTALCAGAVLVVAMTAWWAFAFHSVYSSEHPRIAASRWIFANLQPGDKITGEFWDDTLPYQVPGFDAGQYQLVNIYPYDTDSNEKVQALIYGRAGQDATVGLNGANYIALASNRVRDSVLRMPAEYPATIRYYELLESGELGFDLVARFAPRPTFLGISIDDSGAEESFTVYDHPEVRIYKKSDRWDPARALALLNEAHPERATNLLPRQGRTNGLQFTAEEARIQQTGGTFAKAFDRGGLTSHLPWLWWLLWVQVAAFATVPALTWLLRALPDRGYGLSKVAGFAAVGLLTWMLVAWNAVHFSAAVAWAAFAVVAIGGYALGYLRRDALARDVRAHWRSWLAVEAVFFAAFFFFLALRYANPDLWYHPQGGEKPVEFAYLQAVARSTILPPYDPWFSGGTMNYYYMGWFLVAVPMRALRIMPEVGFNLAIPTYAALAATVAFSTVHNLIGLARPAGQGDRAARPKLRSLLGGGLLGALFLVGIGNLDAGHQTIERFQRLNIEGVDASGAPVYHWSLFSDTPFLGGVVGALSGLYRWFFSDAVMGPFDWWRPSRVHPPAFDITEFPFWSFLFGDLHAHLMGLPFFGLAIALVVAYVASTQRQLKRQPWALAVGMGLSLGLVRTIHTWDFPTAVLLTGAGIVAGQMLRPGRWQQRWWDAVGHLALVAGVLVVAFAPYTAHFEVFESGIVRARETTATNQYFAHFGLFVAFMVAFLAVRYHEEVLVRGRKPGRNPVLGMVNGPWEVLSLTVFLAGLTAFTWRWGLSTIALSAAALVFLFNLLWLEFRAADRQPGRLIATAMFAAAVGIAGGVDVVQAEYDIVRMNTVFKFSLQAWQLYALASAFAAWYVARALLAFRGWRPRVRTGRLVMTLAAGVVLAPLLFGALIYPWSGTRARQEARFPGSPTGTLNGLAYLPYGSFGEDRGTEDPKDDRVIQLAEDEPLIRWLRENVEGSPVIVEAVGPLYHWTGRISWNTGLPTVIGWDWHEIAYRTGYDYQVTARRAETARFYTDSSTVGALTFIEKYNVSYVVVGTEERVFGTPGGLAKFSLMPELREVFRSGENVIYRVERPS